MAMQRIEDMDNIDLEALVSELLEIDPKVNSEHHSFDDYCKTTMTPSQQGFRHGEMNIITAGERP